MLRFPILLFAFLHSSTGVPGVMGENHVRPASDRTDFSPPPSSMGGRRSLQAVQDYRRWPHRTMYYGFEDGDEIWSEDHKDQIRGVLTDLQRKLAHNGSCQGRCVKFIERSSGQRVLYRRRKDGSDKCDASPGYHPRKKLGVRLDVVKCMHAMIIEHETCTRLEWHTIILGRTEMSTLS